MNEIEDLELKISKFLRWGVLIAGGLMTIGWLINFDWGGNPFSKFSHYAPVPFDDLFEIYLMGEEWGYIFVYLGLIFLISLPVIRVFLTAILFVKQKEYILAGVAGFVLLVLMFSFFIGIEL